MPERVIDLNCDMGESFGAYQLGHDDEVLGLITSANVACGFHAGDPTVMRRTVHMALEKGVRIGAHPGVPDLQGFGRRHMRLSPEEAHDIWTYQIGALQAFVHAAGGKLSHVKPHGALFDLAVNDTKVGAAICAATCEIDANLHWLCPSGMTVAPARAAGLKVVEEFYADRAYNADRTLVSRRIPGAVIHDLQEIRRRLVHVLNTQTVATLDGQTIPLSFSSICVHGDTLGALEIIRLARTVCAEQHITIKPFAEH